MCTVGTFTQKPRGHKDSAEEGKMSAAQGSRDVQVVDIQASAQTECPFFGGGGPFLGGGEDGGESTKHRSWPHCGKWIRTTDWKAQHVINHSS